MAKYLISVSGYGATGSSAVIDLLKEFQEITVLDENEYQFLYLPDGLSNLDYKLNQSLGRYYDSDMAIRRFLNLYQCLDKEYEEVFHGKLFQFANEYIKSLNTIYYLGICETIRLEQVRNRNFKNTRAYIDYIDSINDIIRSKNSRLRFVNRFLRKLHINELAYADFIKPFDEIQMYTCIKPIDFIEKTKEFTDKIVNLMSKGNSDRIAINQFLPPQDPLYYSKYFRDKLLAIVINRDPRDLWMHVRRLHKSSYLPHDTVKNFINWYQQNLKQEVNSINTNILRLNFEDLIYKYEETVMKIQVFLGISNHIAPLKYFNPHQSVANTNIFSKCHDFDDEIMDIEKSLPEYLYDFSSVKEILPIKDAKQF